MRVNALAGLALVAVLCIESRAEAAPFAFPGTCLACAGSVGTADLISFSDGPDPFSAGGATSPGADRGIGLAHVPDATEPKTTPGSALMLGVGLAGLAIGRRARPMAIRPL